MARLTLAPTKAIANTRVQGASAAVNADGYTLTHPITSFQDRGASAMERTILEVDRTGQTGVLTLTLKAGQGVQAIARGQGDSNAITCPAGEVSFVGPFDTSRFGNSDGSLTIDCSGAITGNLRAVVLPRSTT